MSLTIAGITGNKVALNVKDFGASPLATAAQNNTAFANTIAAIPAAGGTVIFPESGYLISQSIIIDKDNVGLFGFGQRGNAPIIAIDPSADPTYALICGNTKNVNSCTITGIAFIGKNTTTSTGKGILFRSNGGKMFQTKVSLFGGNGIDISPFTGTIFEVFLEDVELVQNGMNSTTPGDNITIGAGVSDSEFHRVISAGDNSRLTTQYGINATGGAYCKFIDCHCYFCHLDGLVSTGQGVQIIGGEYENNVGRGLQLAGIQTSVIGATFQLNGSVDIGIFSGPIAVIGNQCVSTATFANIYANNAQGGIIGDNNILGCPTGIQLDAGASLYQVHGNNFNSGGVNTILVKATNSDIHDNFVQGTGGGSIIEQTGAQGNNIHDNTLIGGGTITQVGTTTKIRNNPGFNPRGHAVTQPAIAASTVAVTNTTGCDCTVHVTGGTVTVIAIGGTATGATTGAFRVPVGQTIAITYSVAPTWQWFGD